MRDWRLDCPDSDEETDCDALGGTDEDAVDRREHDDAHILRHALWLETSYIPRADCLANRKELTWDSRMDTSVGSTNHVNCYMDKNRRC